MAKPRKSKTAQKNADKHHAAKFAVAKLIAGSSLDAAEPTPDGLGTWLGGRAELKGAGNWVALKSHATRTADGKNAHGTNSHIPAHSVAPLKIEESDNIPCDDTTATA